MKFATTRELSSQTSRVLNSIKKKRPVVVTRHGKPSFLITAIEEDDLEDIVLAEYYDLEKELARVKREDREGKTILLSSIKPKSKRRV